MCIVSRFIRPHDAPPGPGRLVVPACLTVFFVCCLVLVHVQRGENRRALAAAVR